MRVAQSAAGILNGAARQLERCPREPINYDLAFAVVFDACVFIVFDACVFVFLVVDDACVRTGAGQSFQ
jgi:hypothetical protein